MPSFLKIWWGLIYQVLTIYKEDVTTTKLEKIML